MLGVGMLNSLTSMRFVAALVVFVFHAGGAAIAPLFGQGRTGVSFFFILSGFVLAWSMRPEVGVATFYWHRIARIYPLYLLTLLAGWAVTALTANGPSDPFHGALSIFLVQSWVPADEAYFVWNGVSWSLSVEAFFYATFPFIAPALMRLRGRRLVAGQVALVAVAVALGAVSSFANSGGELTDSVATWFVYILPATRLVEFALGITLVYSVRAGVWGRVPMWAAVAFAALGYLAAGLDPTGFGLAAITLIPFAVLIARLAHADVAEERSWLRQRWLVTLGAASYAFYLVHHLVIRLVYWALGEPEGIGRGVVAIISLGASLIIALVLHFAVELPANRFLRARGPEPRPRRIGTGERSGRDRDRAAP